MMVTIVSHAALLTPVLPCKKEIHTFPFSPTVEAMIMDCVWINAMAPLKITDLMLLLFCSARNSSPASF
ncbi:hypothetical protein Q8G50_34985, partial [Klebsiella pneumoniae]